MGSLQTLQLSVAVCAGVVAATLAPSARRTIPRSLEAGLWIALIVLCVVGVATVEDAKARELTSAIAWAGGSIVSTALGLVGAGFTGWVSDHRFAIANWVVIVCGVDVFLLALLSSHRQSLGWQPRVKLRDWMELPATVAPKPVVVLEDPFEELNRRFAAAAAVAAAAAATWTVHFAIWMRDVLVPREAQRLARRAALGDRRAGARLESSGVKAMAKNRGRGLRTGHALYVLPHRRPLTEDDSEHSDRLAS